MPKQPCVCTRLGIMRLALLLTITSSAWTSHVPAQVPATDSAGVKLRRVTLGKPTGRISLGIRNALTIGEEGGAPHLEFNRVEHILRTRGGHIVVADRGSLEIRYFDMKGQLIRKFGRKGAGPGEFHSIFKIGLLANDTLLVSDPLQRRVSVFAPNGQLVRTISFQQPANRRAPDYLLSLTDGSIIVSAPAIETAAPRPQPYYFDQHISLAKGDGSIVREIGTFGMSEHFVQTTTREMGGVGYWSLAYGRNMTVVGVGNRLLMGDGTSFELKYYSSHGRLEEILRSTEARQKVEQRDIDANRARTNASGRVNRLQERMLDEMPYPSHFPSYARFLATEDGQIWIQRYIRADTLGDRWIVLDRNGTFVDEVSMPRRFRLMTVTTNYLLGVKRDENDVEQVFAIPHTTSR